MYHSPIRLWGGGIAIVPVAGGMAAQALQLGERILVLGPVRRGLARDHVFQRGHADGDAVHDVLTCPPDQIGVAGGEPGRGTT